MPAAQTASTETLFHQWRKGDAVAGQAMAQRFTDWYFAISATRLGEEEGDAAFREACTQFSRGVGKVGDARRLLGWAHTIARQQIAGAVPSGRLLDGDLPNAFTRRHSPKELLVQARAALPHEMWLLETAFRGGPVEVPRDLLQARYALKAWLARTYEVPFRVLPERPDPDRIPLVFYEAGRMTEEEETHFELYLLHDMEVCQDVAEFAHYAIALRGGLPGQTPAPQPRPTAAPSTPPRPQAPTMPTVEMFPEEPEAPSAPASNARSAAVVRPSPPSAPAPGEVKPPSSVPLVAMAGGAVALLAVVALVVVYVWFG